MDDSEFDAETDGERVPDPPRADPIAGELISHTFDYDGGREVTVYLPPTSVEAIVYAGDGQWMAHLGAFLEPADVPSTMIVGVHGLTDDTERLHEYSPVFDEQRFATHERFFVEEVREWVVSKFEIGLPSDRTAVYGASAGGELALALGLRHPDIYGVVLSGSPGAGYRPPEEIVGQVPRTYLVAGTEEPFFLENAIRWASALGDAGGEVVMSERKATHGPELWIGEFPLMIAWAFGR